MSMGRTQIENSEQSVSEELSLNHIAQLLLRNWPLFTLLFVVFASVFSALYVFKIPFVSESTIIVNDSKNSSLQSFASQFSGQDLSGKTDAKKASPTVVKDVEYLKTMGFYEKLLQQLAAGDDSNQLNLEEKTGFENFKSQILGGKKISELSTEEKLAAIRKLDGVMKITLPTDYTINVSSSSMDRNLAYFVANRAAPFIANELKDRQSSDLAKIKEFLTTRKEQLDQSIRDINTQLAEFQGKPENLISLSSKDKVGEYISELMMRKNEIRMKISENNKIIASLGGGSQRDSELYGNSGKVKSLRLENDMLEGKLADISKTIGSVTHQAKAIPTAGLIYDELKRKSDIEFQNYKETSESLSKIDAYQLSLVNKYEVLESSQYDKVKPAISLVTLGLVAVILSQVIGSLIIYIKSIWHTSYVTAEATRNVMVVDSHSLDPRVFIENSKIKFKLKNNGFNEGGQGRLSFGVKKKAVNHDQMINENNEETDNTQS